MNRASFGPFVFAFCLGAFLLPGCGATLAPNGPPAPRADSTKSSWMAAESTGQDLLYVSDLGANAVDVFSYPKGALIGELTGFGSVAGLCADKAGDVFVVEEAGPVAVYAHGGTTPIRKLPTSGAPYGCAVDPTTNDLAVTQTSSYLYGAMWVYPKAKGKAKTYPDKAIDATWFCGYDGVGNLFIDAWDRYGNLILVELPKIKKTFRTFKLGEKFDNPGGVQWDGKYIAVGNRGAGVVYRTTETGHVAQTISLKDGTNVEQFWIQGSTIVGPNAQSPGTVSFWRYPAGGSPTKTLSGLSYPFGAAVSLAQKN